MTNYCDDCLHKEICADEGRDDALTYCNDKLTEKIGYWIKDGVEHGHCSVCGRKVDLTDSWATNFCSSCGSKMKMELDRRKALEAAKYIKEYCKSIPDGCCTDCIFDDKEFFNGCALKDPCHFPDTWDIGG